MIHFEEITRDNLDSFLRLEVHENQKDQVASNAASIAQGNYSDKAWFRGIYFNETPVGFVMLSLDYVKKEYWVSRYMVGKDFQGKGYGKIALLKIIDFMKTLPDITEILLTYVPKEKNGADGFYKKIGFIDTGEDRKGEIVMKYLIG